MRRQLLFPAFLMVALVGCGAEPEPAPPPEPEPAESVATEPMPATLPDMIVAERGGFIPEGVEYDTTNDRLLTGSLAEGSIFEIRADGQVTAVIEDPDLVSSVGIEADEPRDRLLVANSDRSVFEGENSGQAMLGVYTLTSGERLAMVDLAASVADPPADAAYFANDVAVADDGTIFVTDTRMGLLYQVEDVDGEYQASVFHRFDEFAPNGIVYAPGGYLLVAGGTQLWKVPVDDPASASEVMLPEEIPGQDGAVWRPDGTLAIVSNSENRVVALTSTDDWATAELAGVASYEMQGTTAAVVEGDVYVVHPHFADADPPSFERVTFE